MIGEIALAIEMGADEIDIGKTIHPHPTLGESIGMAAEVAHGTCTDLPPARRRPDEEGAAGAPAKNPAAAGFFRPDPRRESGRRGVSRRAAGAGCCGACDLVRSVPPPTHAARAVEAACPVAAVHVLDADLGARARRMDELAFADVDADMAEGAAHGVEEHEVAGLELAAVDLFGGGGLFFGAAREHVAHGLVVHRADEAAAVEAGFGRCCRRGGRERRGSRWR